MKNEKENLLCRKVKQLNIVINNFTKENHEREKQTITLQKKYEQHLDQILNNYQTKIQRMLKSFYGQQKYFIDLFRPQYEKKVIQMKSQFAQLCNSTTASFENYQNNIQILVLEVNAISRLIFNLLMSEDITFENITNSMMLKIDSLNKEHFENIQKLRKSNEERILKYNNFILSLEITNPPSEQTLIQNYIKIQTKNMKSRICELKQFVFHIKQVFNDISTNQKEKIRKDRKQFQQLIQTFQTSNETNTKLNYKIRPNNSDKPIQKRSNSDFEKIVFPNHFNKNDKKLKTVLSANSIMEYKLLIKDEVKELTHLLNETRESNQREIFDTQFKFRDEKNLLLKNYSELFSIIKLNIENHELAKKLDKQYKDEKMKKKIEIEKIKNKLDNEYFEKKEKIEKKSNRIFNSKCNQPTKTASLFEQEEKKYEIQYHELLDQLTPQNSEDQRQALRIDLIAQYLKEIEFENKRHSLQMLLYDLQRSSEIAINSAISNYTNTINLLREAIKRQIEINKQGMINTTFSTSSSSSNLIKSSFSSMSNFNKKYDQNQFKNSKEDFNSEKNRIALRAIRTSESNRTCSMNLQRQLDKKRLEMLNFYENKIRNIQNQKESVKKEIIEYNDKLSSKKNAIRYKMFSLIETYKQLHLSEKSQKQKMIEKINSKYDGQIDKLKKSIELMKMGKSPDGGRKSGSNVESKIEKMNWHCEFLNSQLNALTKQLRIAQRTPRSPDQTLKAQKRIKSSFQISAFPHTTH